jgi:hypothetical protein
MARNKTRMLHCGKRGGSGGSERTTFKLALAPKRSELTEEQVSIGSSPVHWETRTGSGADLAEGFIQAYVPVA